MEKLCVSYCRANGLEFFPNTKYKVEYNPIDKCLRIYNCLGRHDSSSVVYKCKFCIVMKFNSQICTTRSQSERLLAFGVKKETADMAYEYKPKHLADIDTNKDWVIVPHCPCGTDIPAWSLHRLIELSDMGIMDSSTDNIYDKVIQYIEFLIKCDVFNKEYLEE